MGERPRLPLPSRRSLTNQTAHSPASANPTARTAEPRRSPAYLKILLSVPLRDAQNQYLIPPAFLINNEQPNPNDK